MNVARWLAHVGPLFRRFRKRNIPEKQSNNRVLFGDNFMLLLLLVHGTHIMCVVEAFSTIWSSIISHWSYSHVQQKSIRPIIIRTLLSECGKMTGPCGSFVLRFRKCNIPEKQSNNRVQFGDNLVLHLLLRIKIWSQNLSLVLPAAGKKL